MRERAEVRNALLKDRFQTVLPQIMKRNNMDRWVIILISYDWNNWLKTN